MFEREQLKKINETAYETLISIYVVLDRLSIIYKTMLRTFAYLLFSPFPTPKCT